MISINFQSFNKSMDSGKLEELGYDMIIVRDLLQALKVIIDFEYQVIRWDDVSIPMNRTKLTKNKRIACYFSISYRTQDSTASY